MRARLLTAAAAALCLTLPGVAQAEHQTNTYVVTPIQVDDDRLVLDRIYTHHMHRAEALSSFMEPADGMAETLAGRMMVDHLILASQARQIYLANNLWMPEITPAPHQIAYTPTGWNQALYEDACGCAAAMRTFTTQIRNPEVLTLVQDSITATDQQVAYLQDPTILTGTTVVLVEPVEQVAGLRQTLSEAGILQNFIRSQVMEAGSLRMHADRLRAQNPQLADLYVKMAEDHVNLANEATAMLRARNADLPQTVSVPERVFTISSPAESVRYWYQHHQHALANNGMLYRQAQDPAVQNLLNKAIEGTNQHLVLLEPFRENIDAD